jgi:hypothetical protein
MNEYDKMGEQNYNRNRTDISDTEVVDRTVLTTDLTEMVYEDADWVRLFQDRTQRVDSCQHEKEASTL